MTQTTKPLLITGVSSGLGRAFATPVLDAGHTVVRTGRTVRNDADAFTALHPERSDARGTR
ncbi:hypothetical protein [Streptomyces sp. G-G2]|uniref:hypothetical protein n=1 Tax=Streptomyces sp. G-G2 TaxID=3046201 RepID=UPI0024BBA9A0|nr:hypothetical protein [Streptomyces sp. G-G2]MDJ0386257.1 hypothetical protein [Streptomyces sp. G-G2]